MLLGLGVTGVGVGLGTPTLSSAAMATVPVERSGMAAGATNTFCQLGFALGIAVLGGLFRDGLSDKMHTAAAALFGGQAKTVIARSPGAAHQVRAAFAHGLDTVFLTAGGIGLAAGLLVLALVRRPAPAPEPVPPAHIPARARS